MSIGLFWIIGIVVGLLGVYCSLRASSPWGIDLSLTDDQIRAASKRFADATEKLSIGCFLYYVFQEKPLGLLLSIFCVGASLIITIRNAKK